MQLPPKPLIFTVVVLTIVSILFVWNRQNYISLPIICTDDCQQSIAESDGFFCEPDSIWNERKHVYKVQDIENMKKRNSHIFFLSNWEPNFHCSHARRIGSMGDGGKWVCDPYQLRGRSDCLIYSAGSNGDFSFETSMKNTLPNCEIHTFDQRVFACPTNICTFHQITFGNGTHPPNSKNWETIIRQLNHSHRRIDVLKIDIEGGEYLIFPFLMKSPARFLPQQILVELHPKDPQGIHDFFELLRKHNYAIFNKEPNLIAGNRFFEYTFIKLHPRFFDSLPANPRKK